MAFAYQELEKYDESLNCYKRAEDIWRKTLPEHSVRFVEIHQDRGECLMMTEQYKEAINEFIQALSLLNSQIWPRIEITSDIAECYFMLGQLANAKEYYIQELEYMQDWEETEAGMKVRILLNLCGIENHMGNSAESDAFYQMAIQDAKKSGNAELISIVSDYKY